MSPGSRGCGVGGRKVGSALFLQPPGPRRPCGRCAWAWRGGSGRGTEPAGGAGGGGTETGACNFCLLAFHDGCAPQPTLLGSTRRDSVLPAPKGDRHRRQPTTEPRFCRTRPGKPTAGAGVRRALPSLFPSPARTLEGFRRSLFRLAQPAPDCSGIVLFTSLFGEPFLEYRTVPCLSLSPPPLIKVGTRYLLAEDPSLPLRGQDIYLWSIKAVAQHQDDHTASVS